MKLTHWLAVVTVLALFSQRTPVLFAAGNEGVALAIIYDTSGSMRDPVRDASGKSTAKYLIANRALVGIAQKIQIFAGAGKEASPRQVEAGLFVFHGEGAREAIHFGNFNAQDFVSWAKQFSAPGGNTPLGNALEAAGTRVLKSTLPRKHVLVITDGINTAGPTPDVVLRRLKQQAAQQQTSLSVHFVAFDVDGKVFDGVKKQGATVVAAADESQLNSQLEFIMQKKILLEEEEPAKTNN